MSFPLTVTPVFSAPAPLIITSTSNLTPNEKRDLLFDVDRTLEIPMEVLNDEWWPLVLNIWMKWDSYEYVNGDIRKTFACRFMKHRESKVDRLKRPKVIRSLVEIEAAKNYPPPAITSAVKEYATLELDLGECARELKRKEVTNIKYKIRRPTETRFIGNSNLKSDILESVSFLTEQGYLVENFRVSQ
ncbi:unnamed protein product [Rhizophagus irregularis]|nr:unnamed protein product [Rhizophagus irregularis]